MLYHHLRIAGFEVFFLPWIPTTQPAPETNLRKIQVTGNRPKIPRNARPTLSNCDPRNKLYFPPWREHRKDLNLQNSSLQRLEVGPSTVHDAPKTAVWYVSSELPIALVDHGVVCVLSCFVIVKLLPWYVRFFKKEQWHEFFFHNVQKTLAKNSEKYDH